jgi:hypothetical protein
MIKKSCLVFILFAFVISIAGCQTVFQASAGAVAGASMGAAEGAKKDWDFFKQLDPWIRENLW